MRNVLLASACALALGVSSANAAPWVVTIDASYVHASGNGLSADGYSFDGAAAIPLNWSNFSVEADLGDRGLSSGHDFDGGGSLIWTDPNFRLAGTVIYNQLTAFGSSISETQYGAGGEWYVNPWLTLSAQGGGVAGNFSAGYVGGTVKGYVCPNLSIAGDVTYASANAGHETDYGVRAEWQVSDTLPLAINGAYHRAEFGGSFGGGSGIDVFTVGLTLHLNGAAPTTLVDTNRTGTLDTIGAIHPVFFTF